MMARGPASSSNLRFVQGLGERLPFPDRHFDFVTMGYALAARARSRSDVRGIPPGAQTRRAAAAARNYATGIHARLWRWRASISGRSSLCVTRIGTGSANAAELMRFYWETIAQCVPPETVLTSLEDAPALVAPDRATVLYGIFSEYTAMRAA